MSYLVSLVLEGRLAVVIGGGAVASRKVEDLLAAGAKVRVVAPSLCDRLTALAGQGRVVVQPRPYRTEDLEGAFVVVAATDDEAVNAGVSQDAVARSILVNVVDRPALCTFTLPAIVRRGALTLAVATEGRCPALASVLREELEQRYGPEYAALLDLFSELRRRMIALAWDGPRIRAALSRIYREGVLETMASGDRALLHEFLQARLGSEFPIPQ